MLATQFDTRGRLPDRQFFGPPAKQINIALTLSQRSPADTKATRNHYPAEKGRVYEI